MPSVRAELLALWVEHFMPQARFHAVVVEDQGQWVAALPLVGFKVRRLVSAGGTPSNPWSAAGELLLDTTADVEVVLDVLVRAMRRLPWQFLWLHNVALDSARWNALRQALDRAGVPADQKEHFQVGLLEIDHDWEGYRQSWSSNHRQKMARSARRLAKAGEVQFSMLSHLEPREVEPWMRRGFEVEDRSWKGAAGTSVLRCPGIFDFYLRQAKLLAAYNQLELAFLECDGRPIAFEYCWNAKGVCQMIKTGYDAAYSAYTPGQLLRYYVLQQLHGEPERRAYDFMGPITEAFSKWLPRTYTVGRMAMGPRLLGRTVLRACKHCGPLLRRFSGHKTPPAKPVGQRGRRAPVRPGEAPLAPTASLAAQDSITRRCRDGAIQGSAEE